MCDRSCVDDTSCRLAMDNAKTETADAIAEAVETLRLDLEEQLRGIRFDMDQALSSLRSELESKITDAKTRVRRVEDDVARLEGQYRTHSHNRLSGRPSGW